MKLKMYPVIFGLFVLTIFLSNAKGVPQAVTKAPGESGLNCGACHSGGNFSPTIQLTLKDSSGNQVTQYEVNKKYQAEVKVTGQNSAKSYGFQMVALSDADNKDQGKWTNLGTNVKTQTLLQRKYLVQSNPRQDGTFTVTWQAPETNIGSVSFYMSGLAVNSNGSDSGDSPISNKITVQAPATSSVDESGLVNLSLYPNPAQDKIFISKPEIVKEIEVFAVNGHKVWSGKTSIQDGIDIASWAPGVYFIRIHQSFPFLPFVTTFTKI